LLDVAAHAEDAHAVYVPEVVAEVELVEVEGDEEGGEGGGESGGWAQEGQGEVWSGGGDD
jgi:hypothetical protein